MRAGALVVGSEILSGKTQDTNTLHLIDLLAARGVRVRRWVIVPDDDLSIRNELSRMISDGLELIVVSGGMGPTHDDMTVESVAASLGLGTVDSEGTYSRLRAKWMERNPGKEVPPATMAGLNKMSRVIEGFYTLENPKGAVEAQVGRHGGSVIVVLPGVPSEYRAITEGSDFLSLLPFDERIFHKEIVYRGRESQIADLLGRVQADNPMVEIGSYPQGPLEVVLRITGERTCVVRVCEELNRRMI